MNTTMSRGLIRLVAGPVAAAGIIGGALGSAAIANASTTPPAQPTIVYLHTVQTQPMQPGAASRAVQSSSSNGGGLMQCTAYGGCLHQNMLD